MNKTMYVGGLTAIAFIAGLFAGSDLAVAKKETGTTEVIDIPNTLTIDHSVNPKVIDFVQVPNVFSTANVDFGDGEELDVSQFRKACIRVSDFNDIDGYLVTNGAEGIITNVLVKSTGTGAECFDIVGPLLKLSLQDTDINLSGPQEVKFYLYLTS